MATLNEVGSERKEVREVSSREQLISPLLLSGALWWPQRRTNSRMKGEKGGKPQISK